MPELPEVETIARALAVRLEGRHIERVVQSRPDLRFPLPDNLPGRLGGRRLASVRRRGKFLLLDLEAGNAKLRSVGAATPPTPTLPHKGGGGKAAAHQMSLPSPLVGEGRVGGGPDSEGRLSHGHPETLILHLGMSGRLVYDGPPALHEHLTFTFDDGTVLRFVDPRRFGMADLWPTDQLDAHPMLARLGLEPLSPAFTGKRLLALFTNRRAPLKAALLDQRLIAGLGNIYVSEALWDARLSPERPAGTLDADEAARLVRAIRRVLKKAIGAGGSSLRDYVQADGELGNFQHSFAVYGREGLACPRCRGAIARSVQSGRSTFFCPSCQGTPPSRRA